MPDIEQYKVRISGCRANCFDEQTIKTALAKKFGTPSAHVSQLLAGKTATINKKFQLDEANKIVCFLEQLGLVAGVESTVSKPCHQKLDHDALTAALKKAEPSVPRNWKYMGCSLVVSCAVVSLFAVYIALIGALFAFSVIHTVNHVTLSGSYDQILLENMLYMVPGGIALLLVLALLKPLIARRPGAEKLLPVFRQDEPVLFNFLSQYSINFTLEVPETVWNFINSDKIFRVSGNASLIILF